jgi:hypothetical protein
MTDKAIRGYEMEEGNLVRHPLLSLFPGSFPHEQLESN